MLITHYTLLPRDVIDSGKVGYKNKHTAEGLLRAGSHFPNPPSSISVFLQKIAESTRRILLLARH